LKYNKKDFPRLLELASTYNGDDPINFFKILESELKKAYSHYEQFEELLQMLPIEQFEIYKNKILKVGNREPKRNYVNLKSIYNELFGYKCLIDTSK